jgi:diguanylate cyclase (GGDEF)-like protein/putative nucleotidyltransferase with HDIG domain
MQNITYIKRDITSLIEELALSRGESSHQTEHKDGQTAGPVLPPTNKTTSKDSFLLEENAKLAAEMAKLIAANEELSKQALYDPLTKLSNRRLFEDRFHQAMLQSQRSKYYAALLYIDLDRFKALNDWHGHLMGDLRLLDLAQRIPACIRATDSVARIGGDEFIVLLNELSVDKYEAAQQTKAVAEKIRETLSGKFCKQSSVSGKCYSDDPGKCNCSVSIGATLFVGGNVSQDLLIAQADAMMFVAKKAGGNQVRLYEENILANTEGAFSSKQGVNTTAEWVNANKALVYESREMAQQVEELLTSNEGLQKSLLEAIELARQLCELRDPFTSGHEKNVGDLAAAIAMEMGFDKHRQECMRNAGYLHDIGKFVVPVETLARPEKISATEYSLVKHHVQAGYDLLKNVSFPWPIARTALEHHERLDGSGYPKGLKGDEISIEGRILAVADVVEAMSALRPYRSGMGIDKALAEIVRYRKTRYDEKVVDACVKLFREKDYKLEVFFS